MNILCNNNNNIPIPCGPEKRHRQKGWSIGHIYHFNIRKWDATTSHCTTHCILTHIPLEIRDSTLAASHIGDTAMT